MHQLTDMGLAAPSPGTGMVRCAPRGERTTQISVRLCTTHVFEFSVYAHGAVGNVSDSRLLSGLALSVISCGAAVVPARQSTDTTLNTE